MSAPASTNPAPANQPPAAPAPSANGPMTHKERFRKGERVMIYGIGGNILLAVIKMTIGILANSKALIADAMNSISDVFAAGFILGSLKIAKRPFDAEHPYGHGKIESLTAFIVGVSIVITGIMIFYTAASAIYVGVTTAPSVSALYAAAFTMIFKEIMFRYTITAGRSLGSAAITASAWDHRSDVIVSFATFVGIAGAIAGYKILDPLAAALVSFFVFRVGFKVVIEGVHQLMDVAPPKQFLEGIIEAAEAVEGVEHVHNIRARNIGQYVMVDLKIDVDSQLSVLNGHDIAGAATTKICEKFPQINEVLVHVNPHIHPHTHSHLGRE